MAKRRKVLVDSKFQLKAAFRILIVSVAVFAIIAGGFYYNIIQNNKIISETMVKIEKAVETENNLVEAFIKYSSRVKRARVYLYTSKIKKDHEESMKAVKEMMDLVTATSERNNLLLVVMLSVMGLYIIFMFFYIIRLTHRISGPAYYIEKQLQHMIDGTEPDLRPLRSKDYLKGIYDKVVELNQKTGR